MLIVKQLNQILRDETESMSGGLHDVMKIHAVRLQPGADLRQSLRAIAHQHQIQAGFLLSVVGSLSPACLRFANQPDPTCIPGKFEILALNGTLSIHGIHVHLAIANSSGAILGGHLVDGNLIYTTAELVIGEAEHLIFQREPDPHTGFLELAITPRCASAPVVPES
jgi:predicted DNA-binding protein with PD1-like motif